MQNGNVSIFRSNRRFKLNRMVAVFLNITYTLASFNSRFILNWLIFTYLLNRCYLNDSLIGFFTFISRFYICFYISYSIFRPIIFLRAILLSHTSKRINFSCLLKISPIISGSSWFPIKLKVRSYQIASASASYFDYFSSLKWIRKHPLSSQFSQQGEQPSSKSIIFTSTSYSDGNFNLL
jgi:hypothetical protein